MMLLDTVDHTHDNINNLKQHCLFTETTLLNLKSFFFFFFMLNGLTQNQSEILQISAYTCLLALSYPLKPAPGNRWR